MSSSAVLCRSARTGAFRPWQTRLVPHPLHQLTPSPFTLRTAALMRPPMASMSAVVGVRPMVSSSTPFPSSLLRSAGLLPAWRPLSGSTASPSSLPSHSFATSSTTPSSPASFPTSNPNPTSSAAPSPFDPSNPSSSSSSTSYADQAVGLSAAAMSMGSGWLQRVHAANQIQLFHMSHVALLVALPAALLLSPSMWVAPLDLALGLLIPWHTNVGMVNVLEDYVPKPYRKAAIAAMYLLSILTALGLLKVNLCGAGLTESFKSLWRQPTQPAAHISTTTVQRVTISHSTQ